MADEIGPDERTNAVGLFNTARSYWRAAEQLRAAPPKVTHPDAPITFLLCHAIELYLKAYLRGIGKTVADLKKVRHRISELAKVSREAGLHLEQEDAEILTHVQDADVAIEARYIVTGFKSNAPNESLSEVAAHLDQTVCAALIQRKLSVRQEHFAKQQMSNHAEPPELEPEASRVLRHLFAATEIEERGVRSMARTLRINEGMLKYHLDQLDNLDFAVVTSSDDIDQYWMITPDGRKYLVHNRLHQAIPDA
jgi:hypothetical protein